MKIIIIVIVILWFSPLIDIISVSIIKNNIDKKLRTSKINIKKGYRKMTIKEVKNGDYLTLKKIDIPHENQVFKKEGYDRSSKKYVITKFNDICSSRLLKGNTEVFTDFIF